MKIKELVDSIRNDVKKGAFDREEILSLCDKVDEFLGSTSYSSFIGLEIKDFYCNGFFGSREYGMEGAVITDANDKCITAKKVDGEIVQAWIKDYRFELIKDIVQEWTISS
jgi:hypothetical protein